LVVAFRLRLRLGRSAQAEEAFSCAEAALGLSPQIGFEIH
jgi:hypothetical protein